MDCQVCKFPKLQLVQNAAARLIMDIPKFSHVPPVLYELHGLPIAYRINLKILILTFKSIHGLAPSYLCDLIKVKQWRARTHYGQKAFYGHFHAK